MNICFTVIEIQSFSCPHSILEPIVKKTRRVMLMRVVIIMYIPSILYVNSIYYINAIETIYIYILLNEKTV